MDDAFGMRRIQRVRHLQGEIEEALQVQRAGIDAMLQRAAFQKFHDDEGLPGMLADFVYGANPGMIERGSGTRFAPKTLERQRVLGHVGGHELEGNCAAQGGVFRLVHHAHTSTPEFFQDAVVRNGRADDGR